MKKNCFYTINPWNRNVFLGGGGLSVGNTPLTGNATSVPKTNINVDVDALKKQTDRQYNQMRRDRLLSQIQPAGAGLIASSDAILDYADPLWHVAGNRHSAAGDSLGSMGKDVFKAGVSSGNPALMLAGAAGKVGGDLINIGWGYGIENEKDVKNNINTLLSTQVTAKDNNSLAKQWADAKIGTVGLGKVSNGIFTDKGTKIADDLKWQQKNAVDFAIASYANAGENIRRNQLSDNLATYSALGGPLAQPYTGALGLMQQNRYIDAIDRRTDAIAKVNNNNMGTFGATANRFDAGGSFVSNFMEDPIQAAMQYIQSQDAAEAQQEAAAEAMAQQQAMEDMQQRLANAETQNQGLQALIDSQGLDIKTLMENQRQYADSWRERMPESNPTDSPVLTRIRQGLIDRGINRRAHQDAILANIMVESKGNLNAKNNTSSARGLLQWLKDRHPKAWDFDSQMDYIANTYNQFGGNNWLDKKAWQRFNNTNDSIEAARLFRQYYERPEKHTYNWTDKYINQMYGRKAFGGELGTNGTDFTNGLLEINVGGNHEENPHGGVQLGVDAQGVPNYVEEGETVYKDYVFSKRMNVPAFMRKQLGLGGNMKEDITFADASKKIAEASKERPNNPMDIAGLEAGLGKLAEVQEAERARMQAEEQNAMMETALAMQPANEKEEYAQEAMLEQAMPMDEAAAEQQSAENMVPEEMGLMSALNCYGGKLHGLGGNMFAGGSRVYKGKNLPIQGAFQADSDYAKILERMGFNDLDIDEIIFDGGKRKSMTYSPRTKKYKNVGWTKADGTPLYSDKEIQEEIDLLNSGKLKRTPYKAKNGRYYKSAKARDIANAKFNKAAAQAISSASGEPIFDWNKLEVNNYNPTFLPITEKAAGATSNSTTKTPTAYVENRGKKTVARNTLAARRASATTSVQGNDSGYIAPPDYINDGNWNLNNYDWLTSPEYQNSLTEGYIPYSRSASPQDIQTAENSDSFRGWTDYVINNWGSDPIKEYRKQLAAKTGNNIILEDSDKARDYFRHARGIDTDTYGAGNHAWGYYHITPEQIANSKQTTDQRTAAEYPQGYWGPGAGNTTFWQAAQNTGYTGLPSTDWRGNDTGNNPNAPLYVPAGGKTETTQVPLEVPSVLEERRREAKSATSSNPEELNPYPTWMRYAPAFGAGIMTLTDALGLTNKPDYTYANRLEAAARRAGYTPNIRPEYLGDYMNYKPLDRLYYANQLQANARATDRGLQNMSGSNRGTAEAAMLANAANTVQGLGNLDRQGEEYNRGMYERKKEYDRRTNMINNQMSLEAAMANARYAQQAQNSYISGLAQAAAMRDAIDQRVGASRSANITNFLTSLGNIGRENFAFNQINSDRSRRHAVGRNGVSYDKIAKAYTAAFGGEVERFKNKKKGGRK